MIHVQTHRTGQAGYPQAQCAISRQDAELGAYKQAELAAPLVRRLSPTCSAWPIAALSGTPKAGLQTGAQLLWRMPKSLILPSVDKLLDDGSYLSHLYPSERATRHRVIEYVLPQGPNANRCTVSSPRCWMTKAHPPRTWLNCSRALGGGIGV